MLAVRDRSIVLQLKTVLRGRGMTATKRNFAIIVFGLATATVTSDETLLLLCRLRLSRWLLGLAFGPPHFS